MWNNLSIVRIGDKYGIKNNEGNYVYELEYDYIVGGVQQDLLGYYVIGRKNGNVFPDKLYLK